MRRVGSVDILAFQPESRALLSHPFATRHSACPDAGRERSVPTPYSFPEIGRIDLRVGTRSRRISLRRRQNGRMSTELRPFKTKKKSTQRGQKIPRPQSKPYCKSRKDELTAETQRETVHPKVFRRAKSAKECSAAGSCALMTGRGAKFKR